MVAASKLLFVGLFVAAFASNHDSHDDHDHDDHDHEGADCSCITGYDADDLFGDDMVTDCDDTDSITALQNYLESDLCQDNLSSYCHAHGDENEYHHVNEQSFLCFQTWSLVVQIHNICPTGAVDEDKYHDFLDSCPNCESEFYVHEGAPNCTITDTICSDTDTQTDLVNFVSNNCVTECALANCSTVWQTVEGIHLLCDHDDFADTFEELFEEAIETTVCGEEIYCNVIEDHDHMANCSAGLNEEIEEYFTEFGALDVDAIIEAGMDSSSAQKLVIGVAAVLSLAAAYLA